MTEPAAPRISRFPSVPLVWIVPLVALAVGGWMVVQEFKNRGPEITIEFRDGNGVEARKTALDFQGVAVGLVTGVTLNEQLNRVLVTMRLHRDAAGLARAGSQFWIVRPEIGLSGIRGLDTLFSGPRINMRPGDGPPAIYFTGLTGPPPIDHTGNGKAFILEAERVGTMTPGAPVFFRDVKVGAVESSRLSDEATSVLVQIRIQPPYADLVRINTRFWNAGGVSFRVNLLGAELKSTSLASLLSGGVAFATPESGRALADVAQEGAIFVLHSEMEKEWLKWRPRIPIGSAESRPLEPEAAIPLSSPPPAIAEPRTPSIGNGSTP